MSPRYDLLTIGYIVGFTGSGKPMTKDPARIKPKFQPVDEVQDDDDDE